jgi:hypothetical protein
LTRPCALHETSHPSSADFSLLAGQAWLPSSRLPAAMCLMRSWRARTQSGRRQKRTFGRKVLVPPLPGVTVHRVFPWRPWWNIQTLGMWSTRCTLTAWPTGAQPRLRHDPDCSHFEWRDGTVLGTPQLATEEQMRTLRACKTCIETRGGSRGGGRHDMEDGKTGGLCPTCNQTMSLTGVCDNCA